MSVVFEQGQVVGLRADPSRAGSIILISNRGGRVRYKVFHSRDDIREYDPDQLVPLDGGRSPDEMEEALLDGRFVSPEMFGARLTASRLAHPQTDSLYAIQAARIEFIPFQLKPLLRFIRADRPRLLIADEVGVGKTIEAGLILKELHTRQRLDRILIVCPKALVHKWREEMRRFDEEFRPLSAENLTYCLQETWRDGGEWPAEYGRSIVHLELMRNAKYLEGVEGRQNRPGLLTLDPPPRFDLVIVDEAHHVRNPETNSHTLMSWLCDVSEAVVFLSATPVHVGSTNLYALLHLLRPELFPDQEVFDTILEPNRFITQAMRQVRAGSVGEDWQGSAADALAQAAKTAWGSITLADDPRFVRWLQRLHAGEVITDEARIRCLRDLEETHSLAGVMNRTRRRDIGRFTIREPHTVSVPFTDEQAVLYQELIEFRHDILTLEHDPRVARLIADTLERQAASCLPALVETIDRVLQTGSLNLNEMSDGADDGDDGAVSLPSRLRERASLLRSLAAALPKDDPKLNQLQELVRSTMEENGPGKVLVFSFFLHTLGYLQRELSGAGLRVATISGQVPDEEREYLRQRFRLPRQNPEALDVLLSSEVGCEGLDYEFCDRLVNYDIPWNPMRIEQRIGRIDRYGQQADKVMIFNFVTPGTVEERIFFRCFDRLGIFRDTVGDLEDVLGEMEELNRLVFDPTLTPEQAQERARQTADNVLRRIEEQQRLEAEGADLLGLDETYLEEVDDLVRDGRFVSADELRAMIVEFLSHAEIDGRLAPDPQQAGAERLIVRREGRAALYDRLRQARMTDRQSRELMRWLQSDEPFMLVTFSQAVARERRDLPFVTPVHPLARLAVGYWQEERTPLTANVVVTDDAVPAGRYAFLCELWELVAARPEMRLASAAVNLNSGAAAPEVAERLLALLPGSRPGPRHDAGASLNTGLEVLDGEINERRLSEREELRRTNAALIDQQLGSLDAYYGKRLERVNEQLAAATNEKITRMRASERRRIETEYDERRKEITRRRDADILPARVAAGLVEVRHAQ